MNARLARWRRPLAALSAAAATGFALLALRPGPPPTVQVLAAARDLPAGTTLRPRDLATVALPPPAVPTGAYRPPGVVGRVLAGAMRRGEVLTDARLVGGGLLQGYGAGVTAAPVRMADAGAVRLLKPGDRIDILATADEDPDPNMPDAQNTPATQNSSTPAAQGSSARSARDDSALGAQVGSPPGARNGSASAAQGGGAPGDGGGGLSAGRAGSAPDAREGSTPWARDDGAPGARDASVFGPRNGGVPAAQGSGSLGAGNGELSAGRDGSTSDAREGSASGAWDGGAPGAQGNGVAEARGVVTVARGVLVIVVPRGTSGEDGALVVVAASARQAADISASAGRSRLSFTIVDS